MSISKLMKKLKVLICDDSKLVRLKLKDALEEIESLACDFEIFEAEDGAESVEIYKAKKPDLIFLDIIMPKKSGVEVVKEIINFDKDAKIIMASSVGTKENLQHALENGAKDFIQKPLNKDKIEKVIKKFI